MAQGFNYNNLGSGAPSGGQTPVSGGGAGSSDSNGGSFRRSTPNLKITKRGKREGFKFDRNRFFKTPTRGKGSFGFINKQGIFKQITDKKKLQQLRNGKIRLSDNPFRPKSSMKNPLLRFLPENKPKPSFQADVPTAESTLEYQDRIAQLQREFAASRSPLEQRLAEIGGSEQIAERLGRLEGQVTQQTQGFQNQLADQGLFFSGARDRQQRDLGAQQAESLTQFDLTQGDTAVSNLTSQLEALSFQEQAQQAAIANAINRQLAQGFGQGELF